MTSTVTDEVEELKPCPVPWCGGTNLRFLITAEGGRRAICRSCMLFGPAQPTETEAITAWNTRPQPEGADELVERLRARVDALQTFPMDVRAAGLLTEAADMIEALARLGGVGDGQN